MPEIVVFDNFHTCEENKKKLIMDCLFLCFNYLTECMNAFCFHNTLDKALLRLKQSISVHKLIQHYIHLVVDYKPPHCQFHSNGRTVAKNKISRPPKKGRKRKLDGSSPAEPCNSETLNNSHVEMDFFALQEVGFDFREYFRQLHVSCLKLLRTDLVFDVDKIFKMAIVTDASFKENCAPCQSQQKVQMSTADALFLLEDCVWKSKHFLGKANNNSNLKSRNLSNAELISPEKFVADTIQVLPDILKKMELWSSYCDDLIRRNEGILDSPGMYVKDARDVKLALSAALNFIAEIISWKGLQKSDNQLLLKEVLAILSKNENFKTQNSCPGFIKNAANKACTYLARFSKSVLILNGGLSIVKAVKACSDHCTAVESSKVLAKLCLEMLHRSWFNVTGTPERGSIYNQRVDFLVKTYFSNVENKLEVVRSTARIVLDEVPQLSNKNSTLTTIKSIHRKNFPLLYRTMCEALVSASAAELVEGNNSQFYLKIWNAIIDTMMTLVNIVKIHSSRINLAALLKRSQSIIQLFFTSGMPVVEAALRVKSVEVLKLLKSLQTVTRFLHSVCCHSKITSDSMVGTYVPTIRARCERLTLEVKGMLISNKIPMECITIAILKNKDLKGNDIISQETVDDDSDEDSELPAEECDKFPTEDLAL